jgi:hypothetical protein
MVTIAGVAMSSGKGARAADADTRIAALLITYDTDLWRVVAMADGAVFEPIGTGVRDRASVFVQAHQASAGDACRPAARRLLGADLYVEPSSDSTTLGGIEAIRFTAHTRCRNATPRGVVVCAVHRGRLYTVAMRQEGCRTGGNPFASGGSLDQIAAGARFAN